jgi:hypothetical protein
MYESEVAGQTDFFYGFGTCWVTDSEVTLRGCGGGITAWKGMLRSETNWRPTRALPSSKIRGSRLPPTDKS